MADREISEELQQQFQAELQAEEARTGLKCCLLGGIDPEECPNPAIADLRGIPKIFVRDATVSDMERIGHELSMVGRSDENDFFAMTNTRHSCEYYAIFRAEMKKCNKKYRERKYAECMDQMIGIILGLKDFPNGFMDTDDTRGGQRILTAISNLWKKAVVSNHGLGEDTISALYGVLGEIGEELNSVGDYRFNVGVHQRRDRNDGDDEKEDDGDDGNDGGNDGGNGDRSDRGRRRRRSSADDGGDSGQNEEDANPRPRQRRRISR